MSVRNEDNVPRILSEFDNQIPLIIRRALGDIHEEAEPNTPMKEGLLRARVKKRVSKNRGKITWASDYAEYQERGYTSGPVKRYTTPGTGAHFAENAVNKVDNQRLKYFKEAGL